MSIPFHRLHRPRVLALLLVFPALLVGCSEPEAEDPPADDPPLEMVDPTTLEYAPELDIDFDAMETTRRGVYYRDDEEGTGETASEGSTVAVHYSGFLPDGEMFDTSVESDEPFEVELGAQAVIPGFDEGLRGMREGGRRTLVIPPQLAYGAQGAGDGLIPPNAVLVFEVELLEVR